MRCIKEYYGVKQITYKFSPHDILQALQEKYKIEFSSYDFELDEDGLTLVGRFPEPSTIIKEGEEEEKDE